MKGKALTAAVLGAVIALIAVTTAAGQTAGSDDIEPDIYSAMDEELLDEMLGTEIQEDIEGVDQLPEPVDPSTDPQFLGLVKRGYVYLARGFVSQHSSWERLPSVKTIFTANSSGRWMHNALPRINATGEARIVDRDGDGIAELVIWHHYSRNGNISGAEMNLTEFEEEGRLSHMDVLHNSSGVRTRGFTLFYMDRDGDMIPERIMLKVIDRLHFDVNSDSVPDVRIGFNWIGKIADRDDDGERELEAFRTSQHKWADVDGDGRPELLLGKTASYGRTETAGRPLFDRIHAKAVSNSMADRNGDGIPEHKQTKSITGLWIDRNGDGAPGVMKFSRSLSVIKDNNTDGAAELVKRARTSIFYNDRNSDLYPEIVEARYRARIVLDRDSDGAWDLIKERFVLFRWIDRNSDGIPEKVIHENRTVYLTPETDHGKDPSLGRGNEDRGRIREDNGEESGARKKDLRSREEKGSLRDRR